jgi:hypothetical protein
MATQDELQKMVSRALGDSDFRKKLISDPEAAARDFHTIVTKEQIKAIKDNANVFNASAAKIDAKLKSRITVGCVLQKDIID